MSTKAPAPDNSVTALRPSSRWNEAGAPRGQPARTALSLFHAGGLEVHVLSPGVPLVVGRTAPAQVCFSDPGVSRAHARFSLNEDATVTVEDLGSTNGTWHNGARIARMVLAAGEVVQLGDVAARIDVIAASSMPDAAAARWTSAPVPREPPPIAVSQAMRSVLELSARVADAAIPVVLFGETGTGKEVLARYLHDGSPRRAAPLVTVNCAAIPAQLVESVLFGHEKGAFTGAVSQSKGVLEAADGGTVLLDEVAELSPAAQAALLRVLETKQLCRVGSTRELSVDVRVLAATHRDLEKMVEAGQFRSDLYYRLSAITITLPPLRDRLDDIAPLSTRFIARACAAHRRAIDGLDVEALALLKQYSWPGNVRELRNAMERAVVVARGRTLTVADLPDRVRNASADVAPPSGVAPVSAPGLPSPAPLSPELPSSPAAASPPTATLDDGADLRAQLQEHERRLLLAALEEQGWNQTKTAQKLGLPIRTLSYKMKQLGIRREKP